MSLFNYFVFWSCTCDTEVLKAVGPQQGYRSLPNFRGTRQGYFYTSRVSWMKQTPKKFLWLHLCYQIYSRARSLQLSSLLMPHRPEEPSQLHFQFSFSSAPEWVCSESWGRREGGGKEKKRFFVCPLPLQSLQQEEDQRTPNSSFHPQARQCYTTPRLQ